MISKKLCIGLTAHVDAGKTTLAESMLFLSGQIRKAGRVDHRDAFLDTHELEKERGITIFSKQAELSFAGQEIILMDTPGHADFSAEMERTLQVLDYAILIVSGADGVQGQVETLWRLLARYQIPVFLFVNKMDQPDTNQSQLLAELQAKLSDNCVAFPTSFSTDVPKSRQGTAGEWEIDWDSFYDALAMCEESVMEYYLENGKVEKEDIIRLIGERKVFPCYFGSALKITGVKELMEGIAAFARLPVYGEQFGARVFKITRDSQGNRLTWIKVMGGNLKVKTVLHAQNGEWEEKLDQIRIYSGESYTSETEVEAGTICAVTGLTKTHIGEGLGATLAAEIPLLEPVLIYQILLPSECNIHSMLDKLRQIEEEEPLLRIVWKEELNEIHAQLMGEVQIEVLKVLILERFGVEVEFGAGSIVYKETILEPVEGVGHFEPLRHYAEVHLLLEPLEPGSGLIFDTDLSEDILDRNWQRLVLTHLEERVHRGVLTGSEITDMKITLINGRAHIKHTEGGDFRQATYRAVRQGLKMGHCRLLEPVYEYTLELPAELVGRAMTDIQKMSGTVSAPKLSGEKAVLTGKAPVATMQGYQTEVTSYSKGHGKLSCLPGGYAPCHNEAEVIAAIGYDSERDVQQPTGSVFCAHGAGFLVDWWDVPRYMHLPGLLVKENPKQMETEDRRPQSADVSGTYQEEELKEIFERTYGEIRQERKGWNRKEKRVIRAEGTSVCEKSVNRDEAGHWRNKPVQEQKEYLLVDGYNIIFGWEDLKELSKTNIEAARNRLMDILCNYQGYRHMILILVFDAYKVEGNPGFVQNYHNIHVVYTKEAETADQYIEKVTKEIGRKHRVTVATSDGLEQMIILGQGASRLSARELREEIDAAEREIQEELKRRHLNLQKPGGKSYLFDGVPAEVARLLEKIRLG